MGKRKKVIIILLMIIGSPSYAQELQWTSSDVIGRNMADRLVELDTMQIKKIPAIVLRRKKWELVDMQNKYIQELRNFEPHVSKVNGEIYIDFDSVEDILNDKSGLLGFVAKTFEQAIGDTTYLFCVACMSFGLKSTRISVFTKTDNVYRLHSIGSVWEYLLEEFVFNVNGEDHLIKIWE